MFASWSLLIAIRDFNGFLNHNKWFKRTTAKISSRLRSSVRSMINCYPLKSALSSTKQNSAYTVHVYNLRTAETASWHLGAGDLCCGLEFIPLDISGASFIPPILSQIRSLYCMGWEKIASSAFRQI